jgi:aryl-alcohol dehydrogenase-like predicted oxidoreductase
MNYRPLGRTPWKVSEISFGAWAIGGSWGSVDDNESLAALEKAIDCGVNFIDTADVYGMGRSERLIAQLKRSRKDAVVVATKAGRRLSPHTADGYNAHNLTTAPLPAHGRLLPPRSLRRARPPGGGRQDPLLRRQCGACGGGPRRSSTPASKPCRSSLAKRVGILARVPLASGLLTGKLTADSQFAADDHRQFNRHGESFDVGETFSGVNYEAALEAADELRSLVPAGITMSQFALRWILNFDAVTCAIPGGKHASQIAENCAASSLPPLSDAAMTAVRDIYDRRIRTAVHQRW